MRCTRRMRVSDLATVRPQDAPGTLDARHTREVVMSKFRNALEAIKSPIEKLGEKVRPFHALEKEAKLGPILHAEVLAALKQLQQKHPEIKKILQESAGYAVVPEIGRASLVLGGAYGIGEVFEHDRVIGYAGIIELTIGVQVGGTTFHELVVFHDEGALKLFKSGKYAFAADAAVEIVKAGAQASKGFGNSSSIYVFSDGGMLLDLAIGGQKFVFKPAALGRMRTAEGGLEEDEKEKAAAPEGEEHEEQEEERQPPSEEEQPGQHVH